MGCADFFKPSDDSEPLPALNALDSAAIAKMKISMGIWNGDVRDWIRQYSGGRVQILEIVSPNGVVDFPDTGFEFLETVNVRVAVDSLRINRFSRLPVANGAIDSKNELN